MTFLSSRQGSRKGELNDIPEIPDRGEMGAGIASG